MRSLAASSTVYPRWRGEHSGIDYRVVRGVGLSPLARGTLALVMEWGKAFRFIPAGAGNTAKELAASARSSVYPRWRGEHAVGGRQRWGLFGLSPLARGTLSCCSGSKCCGRFIPAGAGNTA